MTVLCQPTAKAKRFGDAFQLEGVIQNSKKVPEMIKFLAALIAAAFATKK